LELRGRRGEIEKGRDGEGGDMEKWRRGDTERV